MKNIIYLLALLPFTAFPATKVAEVEHGTNSVIVNVELYDVTDPSACPAADLTHGTQDLNITIFDDVTNGQLDFFECTGAACVTTDTIENITTLGTFATPTANNVRFRVLTAGSCWYQLQFADAIFDTVGANVINIEITDGQSGIIDGNFWIDLTPISAATLIDSMLTTAVTGYNTVGDWGYQLRTVMDALATKQTSIETKVDTTVTNSSRNYVYTAAITSVTSQVAFVIDGADDPGATDMHLGKMLCVEDTTSPKSKDCSRAAGYNTTTDTWTIEKALPFTVAAGDIIYIPSPSALSDLDSILASGITDSGTTASFVDAALTQADTDYWAKNTAVVFTNGTVAGQTFCVVGFVPGTDTVSFSPPATQAIGTHDYILIAAPGCDPFR